MVVVVDGFDLFVFVHSRDSRDSLMSGEIGRAGLMGRSGRGLAFCFFADLFQKSLGKRCKRFLPEGSEL
jgi:hypothetical protein